MERLKDIQKQLIKATRSWALHQGSDPPRIRELRQEAILLNHEHYLQNIPLYRKLAAEGNFDKNAGIDAVKKNLMLSADVFKSYEQTWLDNADYGRMTQWLSGLYHKNIDPDMPGVKSIDDWIDRLGTSGTHVVYSSGTSGTFSFVPRDKSDWVLSRSANIAYLAPLLAARLAEDSLSGKLMKLAVRLVSPDTLAGLAGKNNIPDFDAAFLGFRQGRLGNQVLIGELAPLFRRHYFLYDADITGTALRCLRRGARTEEERRLTEELQDKVVGQKEKNYRRIIDNIRQSGDDGQKVFLFGAPYQFKELCEAMAGQNRKPGLKKGSLLLFGGGWKSFTGEAMDRESLVKLLTETLEIPPQMVMEGYSMTEINMLMLRCQFGRFHIPPVIEPVIFDKGLAPVEGTDISGVFGFLDPMAVSYPGFIITGDYVHLMDGECQCGLAGPAVTQIERASGSEVKGCGGVMGSIHV